MWEQGYTYSPDLMPLEEVFAKIKRYLIEHDTLYKVASTPETLIKISFSTVTQEDCTNYIRHAGYLYDHAHYKFTASYHC